MEIRSNLTRTVFFIGRGSGPWGALQKKRRKALSENRGKRSWQGKRMNEKQKDIPQSAAEHKTVPREGDCS